MAGWKSQPQSRQRSLKNNLGLGLFVAQAFVELVGVWPGGPASNDRLCDTLLQSPSFDMFDEMASDAFSVVLFVHDQTGNLGAIIRFQELRECPVNPT